MAADFLTHHHLDLEKRQSINGTDGPTPLVFSTDFLKPIVYAMIAFTACMTLTLLFLYRRHAVRKTHESTFRSIFLPRNLTIPWLGLEKAKLLEHPRQGPISYANLFGRRLQRDITTQGPSIDSSGRRLGRRDSRSTTATGTDAFDDELPEYKQNNGLPEYLYEMHPVVAVDSGEQHDRTSHPAPPEEETTEVDIGQSPVLTVQQYEAQTRAGTQV